MAICVARNQWVKPTVFGVCEDSSIILVWWLSDSYRADSRFAPSQWETTLFCNDVSHWLGASRESALLTGWRVQRATKVKNVFISWRHNNLRHPNFNIIVLACYIIRSHWWESACNGVTQWLGAKLVTSHYLNYKWPCHSKYNHDDVIKWKHFPRYWPLVWEIHRSPVNSLHIGQWLGTLMFSFDLCLNKRLSKQSWGWWFETPWRSL